MRFHKPYFFAVLFFIIATASTAGWGQTNSTTLPPAAQEAINKGIIAAKIPDYMLAIRYFEEARKMAPLSSVVFFNMGLAESKIPGRELRAICWFEAFLAANPTAANAAAVKEQINTLDVKNKGSVIRLLNMVQEAAVQISDKDEGYGLSRVVSMWVDMGDLPAATKATNLINKKEVFNRSYALSSIAGGHLVANDFESARKITNQISSELIKCRELISIAEFLLNKGDTGAAQKTLADAFKSGIHIHNDPESNIIGANETANLYIVAYVQAIANDISGAQKTFNAIKELEEKHFYKNRFALEKVKLLSAIFLAQTLKGDNAGAQKTFSDVQRALETLDKKNELGLDNANYYMAEAQAKSGDITSAKKTAEFILDPEILCSTQSTIAYAQAKAGDKLGAQKTLLVAQTNIERIKGQYGKDPGSWSKVRVLITIAQAQTKIGDTAAAKKTLAAAQDTADLIKDGSYKNYSDWDIAQAYKEDGIKKIITVVDWVKKLDDSNEKRDCSLNTEPFLDLPNYLKSMNASDPQEYFEELQGIADKIVSAQNLIKKMMREMK